MTDVYTLVFFVNHRSAGSYMEVIFEFGLDEFVTNGAQSFYNILASLYYPYEEIYITTIMRQVPDWVFLKNGVDFQSYPDTSFKKIKTRFLHSVQKLCDVRNEHIINEQKVRLKQVEEEKIVAEKKVLAELLEKYGVPLDYNNLS